MSYRIIKNQKGVPKNKVRYQFDFNLENKRYRKNIICQKSTVDTLYRRWEKQIMEGHLGNFTFFEKLDEYLAYAKTIKSERMYNHERTVINDIIKVFFKQNTYLYSIKRSHIEDFIQWRRSYVIAKFDNTKNKGKLSNSTINRNLAVLSYFFNWCIKKEYYNKINPCFRTKLKEVNVREVKLDANQIKELLEKAQEQNIRFYHCIAIALLTGMRKGEILSLTWYEIDFDKRQIRLSQYKTKSKKARVIPITTTLNDILLRLYNNGNSNDLILPDMSRTILQKEWYKLLERLPFGYLNDGTKLRFHDLRHIYAQSLLDQGVQLEDIQVLLGHQSFETTQKRYAMFARPDLHDKAERIENVIRLHKKSG